MLGVLFDDGEPFHDLPSNPIDLKWMKNSMEVLENGDLIAPPQQDSAPHRRLTC